MNEQVAAEIWREIKRYINPMDWADAADTVLAVMIDCNCDADDIRTAFAGDVEMKRALQGYLDNDKNYEDDDYDEDESDSDSDWN